MNDCLFHLNCKPLLPRVYFSVLFESYYVYVFSVHSLQLQWLIITLTNIKIDHKQNNI